jgi:hypothetical protein
MLTGDAVGLENILRCEEHSCLFSVTAYVLRFVQALKRAIKNVHLPKILVMKWMQEYCGFEKLSGSSEVKDDSLLGQNNLVFSLIYGDVVVLYAM